MAFRRGNRPETAATPGSPPQVPEPKASYIDEGAHLVGRLQFKETVQIDGHVEGEIRATRDVIVGETASIEASIDADAVVVYGSVDGDIRAKRKITLHKSARVTGEIQTAGIVVEEGARFRGCIIIGGDGVPEDRPPQTSTAKESEGK